MYKIEITIGGVPHYVYRKFLTGGKYKWDLTVDAYSSDINDHISGVDLPAIVKMLDEKADYKVIITNAK